MTRAILIFLSVASLVIADQATKHLAEANISTASPVELLPFLSLVNVRNEGAAFGLFRSFGNIFFVSVSALAIGFIVYLLWRGKESTASLVLILSGAIGNLIDRLLYGYVRDFADLHAGGLHWPAFNVADSCLTVGIAVLLITSLIKRPSMQAAKEKEA